jgi:hypothetical protein
VDELRRRRLLVAVKPLVLEGALATILELIALDEVVQFQTATAVERRARYDAAIVTADIGTDIVAGVVITLPDTSGGPVSSDHAGQLTIAGTSAAVAIQDQSDVVALLDEHVPTGRSRGERLARTHGGAGLAALREGWVRA